MSRILDENTTKVVNIEARSLITATHIPIRQGNFFGATLRIKEIRGCIMQKGIVDEVLSTGKLVRLDLTNYNTDNEVPVVVAPPVQTPAPKQEEVKAEVKEEVKEEPAKVTEPAKEEIKVEAPVVVEEKKEEVKVETPKEEVKTEVKPQQQQPQNKGPKK